MPACLTENFNSPCCCTRQQRPLLRARVQELLLLLHCQQQQQQQQQSSCHCLTFHGSVQVLSDTAVTDWVCCAWDRREPETHFPPRRAAQPARRREALARRRLRVRTEYAEQAAHRMRASPQVSSSCASNSCASNTAFVVCQASSAGLAARHACLGLTRHGCARACQCLLSRPPALNSAARRALRKFTERRRPLTASLCAGAGATATWGIQ